MYTATSTGSATAIVEIYPELKGKLNGLAVRVPLLNGSITDCVFEVKKTVTKEEVNAALKAATESGPLKGILGYETKPLVSADYTNDTRSSIIDALSTQVIDGTLIKIYAWYDNEAGMLRYTFTLPRFVQGQNHSCFLCVPSSLFEFCPLCSTHLFFDSYSIPPILCFVSLILVLLLLSCRLLEAYGRIVQYCCSDEYFRKGADFQVRINKRLTPKTGVFSVFGPSMTLDENEKQGAIRT